MFDVWRDDGEQGVSSSALRGDSSEGAVNLFRRGDMYAGYLEQLVDEYQAVRVQRDGLGEEAAGRHCGVAGRVSGVAMGQMGVEVLRAGDVERGDDV